MHDFHALQQGAGVAAGMIRRCDIGRWPDFARALMRLQAADKNADQVCAV